MIEFSLLDDLHTTFYLRNLNDYLRIPATVHRVRARAAIIAGDFDAAGKEIAKYLNAAPSTTEVAERLVPLLDENKRDDQADQLFEKIFDPLFTTATRLSTKRDASQQRRLAVRSL